MLFEGGNVLLKISVIQVPGLEENLIKTIYRHAGCRDSKQSIPFNNISI